MRSPPAIALAASFALAAVITSARANAEGTGPAPAPAIVATGPAGHWSINTGETISTGRDAVSLELGWPSITGGYVHGLSDTADVGFKFDLLFGFEGTTNDNRLGLGFRVPLRLVAMRRDRVSLQLHVDPGLRFYPRSFDNRLLVTFPVGATLGIQVLPELRVALGFDLPLGVAVSGVASPYLLIGPQFGFDLEYLVDKQLLVGLDTRFGPLIFSITDASTQFAFRTAIVVGYKF